MNDETSLFCGDIAAARARMQRLTEKALAILPPDRLNRASATLAFLIDEEWGAPVESASIEEEIALEQQIIMHRLDQQIQTTEPRFLPHFKRRSVTIRLLFKSLRVRIFRMLIG